MVKQISKSPDRFSFQKNNYLDRCKKEGKLPLESYMKMWETAEERANEYDQKEHKNDLEYDLRSTDWILAKARANEYYAQNLYAALCNNDFQKNDVWPILKDQTWSCSWRYAGGIVADILEKGDYVDWYCSGIRGDWSDEEYQNATKENQELYLYKKNNYVSESVVTDEIRADLLRLGWLVIEQKE